MVKIYKSKIPKVERKIIIIVEISNQKFVYTSCIIVCGSKNHDRLHHESKKKLIQFPWKSKYKNITCQGTSSIACFKLIWLMSSTLSVDSWHADCGMAWPAVTDICQQVTDWGCYNTGYLTGLYQSCSMLHNVF